MLTSLAFLQQVNLKKIGKLAEKAKIEENLQSVINICNKFIILINPTEQDNMLISYLN